MPDEPLTQEQVNAMLRDLANNQQEVMADISTIFSTLAKLDPEQYSSAALQVIGYAFKLAELLSPDPESTMKASIARIAQALYDTFHLLRAEDAAIDIKERATFLNGAMRETYDALKNLQIAIDDPSFFDASDLILKSQAAVSLFLHGQVSTIEDSIWNLTASTADVARIYWSDSERTSGCIYADIVHGGYHSDISPACYGPQRPPLNADNTTVFEYRMALPTFLWAITAFLTIGCTMRKNFAEQMGGYLAEIQARLEWVHDKIVSQGLTPLLPSDWSTIGLASAACPWAHGAFIDPRPAIELVYDFGDHTKMPYAKQALIEYGAVEKFSGNHSVSVCTVDVGGADEDIFNKLQLRVQGRMKHVYATSGMTAVRAAIRDLQALRNVPPSGGKSFTDWSLQESFQSTKRPASQGGRSLRAFATFLIDTQPSDTPYAANQPHPAVSLRKLLCEELA